MLRVRISKTTRGPLNIIRIDGLLLAEHVDALNRLCESAGRPLSLDLAKLCAADLAGIDAIQKLSWSGVQLQNVSPYMSLLLK